MSWGGGGGGGGLKMLAVPCLALVTHSFATNFLDAIILYYFRPWPLATLQLTMTSLCTTIILN